MVGETTDGALWTERVQQLMVHGREREAATLAATHVRQEHSTTGGANDMGPIEQLDMLAPCLSGTIAGIGDNQLDNTTPCAQFTVRDVLAHMIGGATQFAAAFRAEEPPPVPTEGDPRVLVGSALGDLIAAIQSPGALDRTVSAPFGEVPGDVFARFIVLDGLVHGWDLATATGHAYDPPAELVADVQEFAQQAIAPEMRDGDTFAAETAPPATASPIERLAAFTGRNV